MGSSESKPSPPHDPTRRRSKEYPLNFNGFIDLYYYYRDRLLEIISEIKKTQASFEDIEKKFNRGKTASIATAATGLAVGILAAPLTGGLSLVLVGAGAAAGVSGGAAMAGVAVTKINKKEEAEEKIESLQQEFQSILESIDEKLEEMQRSCNRMSEGDQTYRQYKLMELELNITGVRRKILSGNTNDLQRILDDLDRLCTHIDLTFSYP